MKTNLPLNIQNKVVDINRIDDIFTPYFRKQHVIGFTNGCFDILHAGHIKLLSHVKNQTDVLVVGINNDESVRRLKGAKRPLNTQENRAVLLACLFLVDYVVIFSEDTPLKLIKLIKPDILAKGGDWHEGNIVGAEFVRSYGGRVIMCPYLDGYSTTRLIEKFGVRSSESR